jgi:hypothetical protein
MANAKRLFAALFTSYTLEGIGYIVAGTFLVAAIHQNSSGWLGSGAWLLVGLAAAPSAALWAWLSSRWRHPVLLVAALLLQAIGISLPALADSPAAALVGAVLFGATFIGVSTITLAAGRLLQFPGAVALLTVGYSAVRSSVRCWCRHSKRVPPCCSRPWSSWPSASRRAASARTHPGQYGSADGHVDWSLTPRSDAARQRVDDGEHGGVASAAL